MYFEKVCDRLKLEGRTYQHIFSVNYHTNIKTSGNAVLSNRLQKKLWR